MSACACINACFTEGAASVLRCINCARTLHAHACCAPFPMLLKQNEPRRIFVFADAWVLLIAKPSWSFPINPNVNCLLVVVFGCREATMGRSGAYRRLACVHQSLEGMGKNQPVATKISGNFRYHKHGALLLLPGDSVPADMMGHMMRQRVQRRTRNILQSSCNPTCPPFKNGLLAWFDLIRAGPARSCICVHAMDVVLCAASECTRQVAMWPCGLSPLQRSF